MIFLDFERLMLQNLIVLAPIFLYLNLNHKQALFRKQEWVMGVFCGIAASLCLAYPVYVSDFLWDLRYVPIIYGILYGGYRTGIIASVIMLAYRVYLGGDALYFGLAVYPLYALTPFLLVHHFFKFTSRQRKMISCGLSILTFAIVLMDLRVYTYMQNQPLFTTTRGLLFYTFHCALLVIAMMLSVFLIEMQLEKSQMQQEIQRSEKLALISEMAASIAHEVRNPLTVVKGFIQLTRENLDEKNQNYMTTALKELERAEFIINDYLNFAKPQLEKSQKIDVSDNLQQVINIMASYAAIRGIQIETSFAKDLLVISDPIKFKQVLMNLIKNGIEAINGANGKIMLQTYSKNQDVVIKIIDNGVGMTREQLDSLGKPFYSTKEKGTGLGLMVTFRLVEAMNGKLEFYTEKGIGTQAIIRVPAAV